MSLETDLIRNVEFFEALDQRSISRIARLCMVSEYSAGEYLARQGEPVAGLFVVRRGMVKIVADRDGRQLQLREIKAGEVVDDLAIIDPDPAPSSAVALSDTSCLILRRDRFYKLMNRYPRIAVQVAKVLARRTRYIEEKKSHWSTVSRGFVELPAQREAQDRQMEPGFKDRIRDSLVDAFGSLYAMKALTRFSAAIIGCPVEVQTRGLGVIAEVIGEVKLVLAPVSREQIIRMRALDDGRVSATVLRPGEPVLNFSRSIRRDTDVILYLFSDGTATLE